MENIRDIQKSLSEASADIMRDKVGGIAIVWIDKNGDTKSAYGTSEGLSSFELIGAIEMLKQRAFKGLIELPEDREDDE